MTFVYVPFMALEYIYMRSCAGLAHRNLRKQDIYRCERRWCLMTCLLRFSRATMRRFVFVLSEQVVPAAIC